MKGLAPSLIEADEQHQKQAVAVAKPRSSERAACHDELLAEQGILGDQRRPRPQCIKGKLHDRTTGRWPCQRYERYRDSVDAGSNRRHTDGGELGEHDHLVSRDLVLLEAKQILGIKEATAVTIEVAPSKVIESLDG